MNIEISQISPLVIFVAAITTNNILLTNFLGMCSYLAISNDIKSSIGLGLAVIFVSAITAPINWIIYNYLLLPYNLDYLQYIVFIMTIAGFVQVIEMAIDRLSSSLYMILGIYLPLITVNCAILGCSLFLVIRNYTLLQSIAYGLGSGIGWALAIIILAGIREKMKKKSKVLPELEGAGISLIITGIIAMGFIGFSGMVRIN